MPLVKAKLSLCFIWCAVAACDSDPAPGPVDSSVFVPRDIQSIPIDGMALVDLPATDINNDRNLQSCVAGDWRPCECAPTVTGRQNCVNGMIETTCHCGDASPDDVASAPDATGDQPAADGAPTDAGSAMDAAQGD